VVTWQLNSRRSGFSVGRPLGQEITEMLRAWRAGDERALDQLAPQVYRELHRAARQCMRGEHDGHTLLTTALIDELYPRMADLQAINFESRAHFFAICARQMRRILIELARVRRSHKRGSGEFVFSLDDSPEVSAYVRQDLVDADDALKALAGVDERKSNVVDCDSSVASVFRELPKY